MTVNAEASVFCLPAREADAWSCRVFYIVVRHQYLNFRRSTKLAGKALELIRKSLLRCPVDASCPEVKKYVPVTLGFEHVEKLAVVRQAGR